jgi:hypothetical protein
MNWKDTSHVLKLLPVFIGTNKVTSYHAKPDKAKVASSPAARRNATSEKSESSLNPLSYHSHQTPASITCHIHQTFLNNLYFNSQSTTHSPLELLHHVSFLVPSNPTPLNTANHAQHIGRALTTSTWTSRSSRENASLLRVVLAGVPPVAVTPSPSTAATSATPSGVAPPKDTS